MYVLYVKNLIKKIFFYELISKGIFKYLNLVKKLYKLLSEINFTRKFFLKFVCVVFLSCITIQKTTI